MFLAHRETIDRVEARDTGELFVGVAGAGSPAYEYVYRAAAGVYWDASTRGFRSTPMDGRSAAWWYSHIVDVVRSELGVELALGREVKWRNVSEAAIEQIVGLP